MEDRPIDPLTHLPFLPEAHSKSVPFLSHSRAIFVLWDGNGTYAKFP
jgi:hypothetical protein